MSRKTTDYDRPRGPFTLTRLVGVGLAAGVLGAAAMTASQKVEQLLTGRPNSLVPGLALARMLGRPDTEKGYWNLIMHYGQGTVVGLIRAGMSIYGLRGPIVDFVFTGVRISVDQTIENWTGAGAPPWTWPVNEQLIDIIHKGVYAFTTGYLCDLWLQ